MTEQREAPPTWRLVLGFAIIYFVWGSTYLAIKFAVQTLPPFLMAGVRFLLAGSLLYGWLRTHGVAAPTRLHWRLAIVTGIFLLLGGNGLVTWGQQTVPSGVAALIVATTPLWMALCEWLLFHGPRPRAVVVVGMLIGFAGTVLLLRPGSFEGQQGALLPMLAIAAAPILWCIGSLQARQAPHGSSALLTSAMQMIVGGAMMLLAGTLFGEWDRVSLANTSARSAVAFLYLVVIGSLVAFTTYTWLLRVASPASVSTYAYVNPLVAVFFGWLFGDETLDSQLALAGVLILTAVVMITLFRQRPSRPVAVSEPSEPEWQQPGELTPCTRGETTG